MTFTASYDLPLGFDRWLTTPPEEQEPEEQTYYFEFGNDEFTHEISKYCTEQEALRFGKDLFLRNGYCQVTDEDGNVLVTL